MPTPRKSSATLRLRGAFRKHPERARADVVPAGPLGPWRRGSTDARRVYDEVVACAAPGVLTESDRPAVELAVALLCQLRSDPAATTPSKATALINVLTRLGMTPSGRRNLDARPIDPDAEAREEYAEFITPPRRPGNGPAVR